MKIIIIQTLDPHRENTKSEMTTKALESLLKKLPTSHDIEVHSAELNFDTLSKVIPLFCQDNDLIFTIGGTGLGLDDCVPECSKQIYQRECPGIAELMRSETAKINKKAWISRYTAGIYNHCLIVNLPGKKTSVIECFECAHDIILHTAKMLCKLK